MNDLHDELSCEHLDRFADKADLYLTCTVDFARRMMTAPRAPGSREIADRMEKAALDLHRTVADGAVFGFTVEVTNERSRRLIDLALVYGKAYEQALDIGMGEGAGEINEQAPEFQAMGRWFQAALQMFYRAVYDEFRNQATSGPDAVPDLPEGQ
jgi:hypothetical protein